MGLSVISAPVCLQLIPLQAPLKTMLQMSVVPLINSKNLDPHKFQKKIYKHPEAKCFCLCRLDKEGSAHPVGWWDGLCGGGSWVSQCEYVHRWSSFTIAGWTYTSVTHFCHPGGGQFFLCRASLWSEQIFISAKDCGKWCWATPTPPPWPKCEWKWPRTSSLYERDMPRVLDYKDTHTQICTQTS